jgi:threonine synthase
MFDAGHKAVRTMAEIEFYSTNGDAPEVDLRAAMLIGMAPDRGLFMPRPIPRFSEDELAALRGRGYAEVAFAVLRKFAGEAVAEDRLHRMCAEVYGFEVPLEPVLAGVHVLRLDRGPTASFKDFAAGMMGRLLSAFMEAEGGELTILTATSGDTGSAIAHAFHGAPRISVVVLFPPREVSDRQRRQMTTLGGNVTVIGVDGKFDDCQALVKRAFADPELQAIRLTSANSINIGRLLPQIVYYVYAWCRLAAPGEPVVFSVPCGNFGDLMGGLLAWRMGLPIRRLIVATNANDEAPRFLATGRYEKVVPSRVCISNAMNVGHPSNFARVIDLYGGWMDETGAIRRPPDLARMREDLWAISVDDDWTRRAIREAWERHGLLLEPHGAVAWAALQRYREQGLPGSDGLLVSLETAHPAKFPEEITALLGFEPAAPPSLQGLESREEHFLTMENEYGRFRDWLLERYGS